MNIYKAQELILKEIVSAIKNDSILENNVINAALLGSFRTKEVAEKYSDLDILLILKSNRFGEIDLKVISDLKSLAEKLRKHGIEISFLSHTIFEFENYVDANYLIHYSWGDVFYGNKKNFSTLFNKIIKTKNFDDRERKQLIKYNIAHARFNLLRKYISWTDFSRDGLKKLLKLYIDGTIEICDWALVYKNIFLQRKREMLKRFSAEYKDWEDVRLLDEIIGAREGLAGTKIDKRSANAFIQKLIKLIDYCNRKIYE